MAVNLNNGKAAQKFNTQSRPTQSKSQQQPSEAVAAQKVDASETDPRHYLEQARSAAEQGVAGLRSAKRNNIHHVITRQSQELAEETKQLENTFRVLLDPDLPVNLALASVAAEISNNQSPVEVPSLLGKYELYLPGIPEIGGFSGYYSSSQESDRLQLLGTSTSTEQDEWSNDSNESSLS